jgi:hypothetical protein
VIRVSSIFSQMLQLLSRHEFEQDVSEHRADAMPAALVVGGSSWPCCSAIWEGPSRCARSAAAWLCQ